MRKFAAALVLVSVAGSGLVSGGARPARAAEPAAGAENGGEDRAADAKRGSSLFFSSTQGQAGYQGILVESEFGLDPEWLLKASVNHIRSAADEISNELRLGGDLKTSEAFSFYALFVGRTDPSEIRSKGLASGLAWSLSSLWNPDPDALKTGLSLDFETLNYEVAKGTVRRLRGGGTTTAASRLAQRQWTFGLSQELTGRFSVSISYNKFNYDRDPALLDEILATRRIVLSGIQGVVSGFLDHVVSSTLRYEVTEAFTTSLTGTSSFSAVTAGEKTSTLGLTLEYGVSEHWHLQLEPTGSRTDGQKDAGTLALGAEYHW